LHHLPKQRDLLGIFSSAFREHFAEHKKLRGRPYQKMKHPASMGIPFSEIPMSC